MNRRVLGILIDSKVKFATMIGGLPCDRLLFFIGILVHSICKKVKMCGKDLPLNIHENYMSNLVDLYFNNYFLALLGRSHLWFHFHTTLICKCVMSVTNVHKIGIFFLPRFEWPLPGFDAFILEICKCSW